MLRFWADLAATQWRLCPAVVSLRLWRLAASLKSLKASSLGSEDCRQSPCSPVIPAMLLAADLNGALAAVCMASNWKSKNLRELPKSWCCGNSVSGKNKRKHTRPNVRQKSRRTTEPIFYKHVVPPGNSAFTIQSLKGWNCVKVSRRARGSFWFRSTATRLISKCLLIRQALKCPKVPAPQRPWQAARMQHLQEPAKRQEGYLPILCVLLSNIPTEYASRLQDSSQTYTGQAPIGKMDRRATCENTKPASKGKIDLKPLEAWPRPCQLINIGQTRWSTCLSFWTSEDRPCLLRIEKGKAHDGTLDASPTSNQFLFVYRSAF